MIEPASIAVAVAGFLAKTFAGRKVNEWLSNRDKRKAFAKALDEALTKVAEVGYPVKGPGALDEYLLTLKPVKDHFWAVLLDPSLDKEIDYALLGQKLKGVYREDVPTADKALEAIEFFADVLMDALYQPALIDLINAKIIRQHDLRLSLAKKKALVRDYLRAEGEVISKHLLEDLGEGNRYVEPLIEKKEEKKREGAEAVEETESFVPIDMNTYFTEGPDRKIVVVADSGYGKTTLLRELLLHASTPLEGKTFDVNAPIPVYFTPSEAAGCSEENIVGKVKTRLMMSGYREGKVLQLVQDEFQNGRFVFLIDALDQVLNRQRLLGVLEGRAFRSNRVVVTCRPNVWEMEKGHFRDYIELHIRGFDESRWEEYLGADRLNDLRDMVDEDFLSVPILLRLIVECWSQRDKETEPVRNRADLYTKVFNRLLKRQEELDSADKKTRKLAYVRTDLRLLAHHTLAVGYLGQFPRHDAAEILSEDRLDDLEARRWILETTQTGEEISFRHRSFQEYLAAEYLKSTIETEEDLGNLEPYLFHPNWEESLRFIVGLLPAKSAEYLVDRILSLAKGRPLFLYREHLRFASLCLREIGEKAGQTQRKMIFEQLAEDLGNVILRDTAMTVLSTMKDKKAVDLLGALLTHQDSVVRRSAVDALGQIKSEKAVEPLIKALQDPEADVRGRAASALGEIKSEKTVEPLINALQDPEDWVRGSAADALGQIKSEKAAETLITALQDPQAYVRSSAADALGGLGSKQTLAKLVDAWNQESSDIDRPLLLDATRSCDRKVRSALPITSAGNKQFK